LEAGVLEIVLTQVVLLTPSNGIEALLPSSRLGLRVTKKKYIGKL
jgi:hypothetical protein